ncbi:MAG: 6-phosphofructokinase [Candidatus Omnitrophota bacterium]
MKLSDFSKIILFGVSGGDCPGLNAILAGLVETASTVGIQVATLQGGFRTLCAKPEKFSKGLRVVNPDEAEILVYLPSIISGSSRTKMSEKNQENAVNNVKDSYAVVLVGGDDHARQTGKLAKLLKERNIQVPVFIALKTVDNDTTAKPIGADTAIEHQRGDFLSAAVTAWAHRKVSVYENMGRDRGWVTIGAGDIRLSRRDKEHPERVWVLKQIGPAIINLIPEKPSYLVDLLIEIVERMSQKETLYDARLRPIGEALRLYALPNVCEGYQFKDFAKSHQKKRDTLFYRLLELDRSLKAKFYATKEHDIHGNPKLAGLSNYIASAIKYIPELAKYNRRIKKALDVLCKRIQEADISEEEVFTKEKRYHKSCFTIISGVRHNLPNYIIRGQEQNIYDRTYGLNIGRYAFSVIQEARKQIEAGFALTNTGFVIAVNKDEDPLTTRVKLIRVEDAAKGVDVTTIYTDTELQQMGVWWGV